MWKKDNKGFSLVELIVVIAIMAVLVAVLAPQYLRYVERARLVKDNTTISEVANTVKYACFNTDIYGILTGTEKYESNSGAGNKTITFQNQNLSCPELDDEMELTFGTEGFTTTSTAYSVSTTPIEITINRENGGIVVRVSGWIDENNPGSTTTKTF